MIQVCGICLTCYLFVDLTQLASNHEMYTEDEAKDISDEMHDFKHDVDEFEPEYSGFMASQGPIEVADSSSSTGDQCVADDVFVRDDEELSDLDCFMSIQQLLSGTADERRRVEFILQQFNKNQEGRTTSAPRVVQDDQIGRRRISSGKSRPFKTLGSRKAR